MLLGDTIHYSEKKACEEESLWSHKRDVPKIPKEALLRPWEQEGQVAPSEVDLEVEIWSL